MLSVYKTLADIPDNFLGAEPTPSDSPLRNCAASLGVEGHGVVAYAYLPLKGWSTILISESGDTYIEMHGASPWNARSAIDQFFVLCTMLILSSMSTCPITERIDKNLMVLQ